VLDRQDIPFIAHLIGRRALLEGACVIDGERGEAPAHTAAADTDIVAESDPSTRKAVESNDQNLWMVLGGVT
jgi:hypothetical protein